MSKLNSDLSVNTIHGSIPDQIGQLDQLITLKVLTCRKDLSYNQLTGTIPTSLGNLRNLQVLTKKIGETHSERWRDSDVSDEPNWFNLAVGDELKRERWLSVTMPLTRESADDADEIEGREKIREGVFSKNKEINEDIFVMGGNGVMIPTLLHWNANPGPWGQLPITHVIEFEEDPNRNLGQNLLTGKIPPSLGRLSSLQTLRLPSNNLRGDLPKDYENLKNLTIFSGNFICQCSGIGGNYLSGPIPTFIAKWVNLYALYVSDLQTMGFSFPKSANLSSISSLILRNCSITGSIPPYIADWSQLGYLDLSFNNLTGGIPNTFKKLFLYELYLTGNMLNGTLPDWIYSNVRKKGLESPFLLLLSLRSQKWIRDAGGFTGVNPPMPKSAVFPSLSIFWSPSSLVSPSFIAVVPRFRSLFMLPLSRVMAAPHGTPITALWVNVGYCVSLNGSEHSTTVAISDLAYNEFIFPEPVTHKNLPNNNSRINLTFPAEIVRKYCPDGQKKSQYNYNLHINTGGDEHNIEGIRYEADNSTSNFYVNKPAYNWAYSCNGYFFADSTADSREFIQKVTCGAAVTDAPLYDEARLCPNSLKYYGFCLRDGNYTRELRLKDFNIKEMARHSNNVTIQSFEASVREHLLEIELFWAGKGSLYDPPYFHGPLISAISVTPNFEVNRPGGLSKKVIVGIVLGAVLALILFMALVWRLGWIGDRELRVTTVNLRGKSYTLKQVKVATRNFSPRNVIGTGRFGTVYKAELPNQTVAVKMLSSQSKHVIDQIGTEVYALTTLKHENIVEFLDGYSKKDLNLLIYEYMEKGSLERALFDANSSTRLDWPTRVRICHGIAKGLKYLHEDNPSRKIVHRNIKPSNILLDGNLNAKVSDLGLAKLYDEENPYKFIQEKGTVVYMAPEYAMRKAITEKVDVFSFGIVLLEIISGQTNAKYEANQETEFLLDTAIVLHSKGRLSELVDKQMPNEHVVMKQAKIILELAMRCVDQSPTLRPTMSEVVSELERISN
ncbi:putative LRR receptor-like serine/threonine-protein kinase [Citrus sinensis]|uniref:LRR receptor-like serine/threonine-protein kinase n=1 Tax=Citrus sinensis TaxID=2711 RepID=A0ACB8IPB9_CITSI|nr:putative LRR receptor-like serine/threonine-protein kinase [Citrus sinensis]